MALKIEEECEDCSASAKTRGVNNDNNTVADVKMQE